MAGEDFLSKIIDFTSSTIIAQNVKKLYDLLYPHIAQDFRHIEDCKTAMSIVDTHTHLHTDSTIISSVQLPTQPPTQVSAVNESLGLALIGTDAQTGLAAKISASVVIKPFKVT